MGDSWASHCCPAKEVPWLQENFVPKKGHWCPVGEPGRGEGYLQSLYTPSQGTCHPAFWGDGLGIR